MATTPSPAEFVEARTGGAPFARKALRYLFPDHWSFLLGELALYCFVTLIGTGIFLALFFEPSTADTVYRGTYEPLRGATVSEAYKSVVDLSFDVKAGLLIRQTHHWAADVFMAAIVVHLLRIFFTGAFRRPRELTYVLGVLMLFTGLLEGYLGYSIVDDLLSGMGLAIGYGVAQSIPLIGGNLSDLLWGGPFPGSATFESRMYIAHVLLFPALIAGMLGAHLALVASRHHTQWDGTDKRLRGIPLWPGQAARSLGLLFVTVGVLFLLGGLVQINPVWQWGPFSVADGTNGAQPDWYAGWLIGALRLMPGFDVTAGGETLIPNPFWGGVLFPLFVVGVLLAYPWVERRLTGDRAAHNVLQRSRDTPNRTAFGSALAAWILIIFVAGSADRVTVLLGVGYVEQISFYRIAVWVIPVLVFWIVRRWCRALQVEP